MKKLIYIFLVLCTSLSVFAQQKTVDKVIGVVGDNIILLSDVEAQLQQAKAQGEIVNDRLRCTIFDQLLLDKFFLAQAQLDSVYVSEDEVEAELDKRIRYFITNSFGSQQKLEEYYGKSTEDLKDDFRKDIRNQMLAEKMQSKIYGSIKTTPSDVKLFFDDIPKDSLPYFNAEIELSQIVIKPKASDEAREYALYKANQIRKEILNGGDFSIKATLNSDDPGSKKDGGDLGFISRGEMVQEFEAGAFKLKEGEISEVIETQFGYHIIQCLERKGERIHVRHILISPPITSIDEQIAVTTLDSIAGLIKSGIMTFEQAVKEFSEDDQSKSNNGSIINQQNGTSYFEMNEIDGSLLFSMSDLKKGQVSQVSPYEAADGNKAFRIIMIKSESEPHVANLKEDYSKIQGACKQAKQQEALVKWIQEKRGDAYIMIDDEFQSCDNAAKWLNTNKKNN
ncbi:MAG: peptidylprolyl isomerase [Bacteroidota bacterium]